MYIFILVFRLFYTKIRIKIHESMTSVILSVSMRKIRIKKLTYYENYNGYKDDPECNYVFDL